MKQQLFFTIIFLLWVIILPQGVFWASWDIDSKPETLREMSEKIGDLKQEKELLDFKWKTFRVWNENLWDLIKTDLTEEETDALESLILEYSEDKENFEEDIEEALADWDDAEIIHKALLSLKQNFYMSLLPYLQESKIEEFKTYITSDINYREKSNEVAVQISQKNVERDERVVELQEKIKTHREKLNEQIRIKASERIKGKLDAFVNQEKFINLSSDSKIQLFERLLERLEERRERTLQTTSDQSLIEENEVLYEIVEEVIRWYLSQWY